MLKIVKIPKKRFFLAMELNNSILLRYTATTVLKRSSSTLLNKVCYCNTPFFVFKTTHSLSGGDVS